MDIVMVPGLWLRGSSWERVIPTLEAAGHRTHPLTLPGMESKGADRSRITLQDHVDAVVKEIDACAPDQQVVLVGHSAGCAIAHAAVDRRPNRVGRAIYVGGFPIGDGQAVASGFRTEGGDLPMPDLSEFDDRDLADLDEPARTAFRQQAIPSPAHLAHDPQQLSDERRYAVPVTAIATEYTTHDLRQWIAQGEEAVQEFTRIRIVEYVDLPTGHWPQLTRPVALARMILTVVEGAR
ncbi:MAG: alpha/beta fold hydrolase [Nocardioidaceae bacterium]